jgi:hypothetical protein
LSKKNVDERFIEIFAEAIHETLQDIVGESPAQALLFHLNFPESAKRSDEFAVKLRGLLRDGSPVVESAMVKRLWTKLGLVPVHMSDSASFVDSIRRARELFEEKQRKAQAVSR